MRECEAFTQCDRCYRGGSNKHNQCVQLDDQDIDKVVVPFRLCRECLQELLDFTDEPVDYRPDPNEGMETTDAN